MWLFLNQATKQPQRHDVCVLVLIRSSFPAQYQSDLSLISDDTRHHTALVQFSVSFTLRELGDLRRY